MKILFTGGLGYIGSITAAKFIKAGHEVVIVDNLLNSKISVLEKIEKSAGKRVKFYQVDLCDLFEFEKVFSENKDIQAVIHFAGLKAVGESVRLPLRYYQNNLISTLNLLEIMQKYGVKNLIFSSSATVYDASEKMPLTEDSKLGATNPYGRTKLFIEQILTDYQKANPDFNCTLLRYFNPIGASDDYLLGEDPNGVPNNLMPYICKVACGELEKLSIFGNDYKTKDGTGVRDYIHVEDLAEGHLKAFEKMGSGSGLKIYNLGTGKGYSVLDIVTTFNRVNGDLVKYEFAARRPGDVDECYASPEKAKRELGFKAEKSLEDMCKSSYLFKKNNK